MFTSDLVGTALLNVDDLI